MKQYIKTYENLINQWGKGLYTPKQLLDNTAKIISKYYTNNFSIIYSFDQILQIMQSSNYKFKKQFVDVVKNIKYLKNIYNIQLRDFLIIGICNAEDLSSIANMISGCSLSYKNFNPNVIYEKFKEDKFPKAQCFKYAYSKDPLTMLLNGCRIFLNRSCEDFSNYNNVQSTVDHELNHYFGLLNEDIQELAQIKNKENIISIGKFVGYDINQDFILHMFMKSEFISMVCDVCNNIQFIFKKMFNISNEDLYLKYLKYCTEEYIKSPEFILLDQKIQNSIFFSYSCKQLDQKRWKYLKEKVKQQLDIKEN